MTTYIWRKNFVGTVSDHEKTIRGKLAVKTKEMQWLQTESPVIILVSIDSAFHEGIGGDLKMNALISTIKNNVKGKITVLLSDRAHLKVASLCYQNNATAAFEECYKSAQRLSYRYQSYFQECNVVFWHSYICQDDSFNISLNLLKELQQSDLIFRDLLYQDASETYTDLRAKTFPDKELFIDKTIEDLLEQCASLMVLANKGYRFQFYPGKSYASVEYVNRVLIPKEKQLYWIDVFLSIEKKTIIPNTKPH